MQILVRNIIYWLFTMYHLVSAIIIYWVCLKLFVVNPRSDRTYLDNSDEGPHSVLPRQWTTFCDCKGTWMCPSKMTTETKMTHLIQMTTQQRAPKVT